MKVLIIGVNSFTGQNFIEYLRKKNITIFGTSNCQTLISDSIFPCDITNKNHVANVLNRINPDCIINFAGITFVAHNNLYEFYKVNTLAVETILQTCLTLDKKPKKIILISSSNVYGNQTISQLHEDLIPKPQNHYGLSKLAMETIASWYADKLNIIITRPFNYTGVNQNEQFLVPKIVNHFRRKEKIIELGNINIYREFNDIEFVCDIYYKLLMNDIPPGTYNICSSKGYCIKDILEVMQEISGHQLEIKINSGFVRENEIQYLVGSNQKLKTIINDLPQNILPKTLEKMFYH